MVREFWQKFRWLILPLVVVLVIIGLISYQNAQTNLNKLLDLKRVSVQTRDLRKLVIASGTVVSNESTDVVAPGSGKLTKLYVSENEKVSKDQLLAKFEIKDSLGRTSKKDVKSPRAGTITKITAKVEDNVLANAQLFQVIDLNTLYIEAEVVEADINKVKIDQDATVTISALDDLQITARVNFISLVPIKSNTDNSSYIVKLNLKSLPETLRIGMSADVDIVVDSLNNALAVDDSYVYKKEGKYFVKTYSRVASAQVELNDVEIQVGFRGENGLEIKSGVVAGTELVLPTDEIKSQRGTFSMFGR